MILRLIDLLHMLFPLDKPKETKSDGNKIVFTDSVASWSRDDTVHSRFSFSQIYKEIGI